MMRGLVTIVVALWLSIATGEAQTPAPAPPSPAAESSIHAYGDRDKTCIAWTDTCRTCTRGDGDTVHCSNIGIACQPAEITCTTRQPAPAK